MEMQKNRVAADLDHVLSWDELAWRLDHGTGGEALLRAQADRLSYSGDFAVTRRMPEQGFLRREDVQQIVLGWQLSSGCWHLGLVLAAPLAEARGSRWCELARWRDPDHQQHFDAAREAGMALSRVIDRPFHAIPPKSVAPPPPPPLPEPPLHFGTWTLTREAGALRILRARRWQWGRIRKALWYFVWALVYAAISIATLASDLALPSTGTIIPNTALLPYLGLGIAVVLLGMMGYQLFRAFTEMNEILIDPQARMVEALRGETLHWEAPAQAIKAVVISEVVKQRRRETVIEHGEINFLMHDEKFHHVLTQAEPTQNAQAKYPDAAALRQEGMVPLDATHLSSDLQVAGLHIARMLGGLPCYYDLRTK